MSGKVVAMRYKQDQPGRVAPYPGSPYLPFGAFAMSARVQGLALKVAKDIAVFAKGISPTSDAARASRPAYRDSFVVAPGRPLKIEGLNRVTALVGNTSPKAPSIEWGSGEASTDGELRPQGGGNHPFRVLGRAGRAFGDFHE